MTGVVCNCVQAALTVTGGQVNESFTSALPLRSHMHTKKNLPHTYTHPHTHTRRSDWQHEVPGSKAGGTQKNSGTREEERGVGLRIHNNNKEHENTAALYSRQHKQHFRHHLE